MSRAVLKAGDAPVGVRGMCGLDLRDIAERAEAMMGDARAEAERIKQAAHERLRIEREAVLREARRLGQEEGLAAGRESGLQQALVEARARLAGEQAELISAMRAALARIHEQRERMFASARRDVVVLAIAIAMRICRRLEAMESVAPEIAAGAVSEALELVAEASEVRVRLHPADVSAVEALIEDLGAAGRCSRHVQLNPDEGVRRGGAIVSTADSEMDATMALRLERIADELVENWRGRLEEIAPATPGIDAMSRATGTAGRVNENSNSHTGPESETKVKDGDESAG